MKPAIPVPLEAEYNRGTRHIGLLLRLVRRDGTIVGLTSAARNVTIAGVLYQALGGLMASSVIQRSGLAVDNLEMSTLNDGSIFVPNDVYAGRWKNAKFLYSKYNYASPTDGIDPIFGGSMGNARIEQGMVIADLRGVQQFLQQQTISVVTSKACRAELGDDKCRIDLTPYTVAAVPVTARGQQTFTASSLGQASDYFGNGELLWTSGDNIGLNARVKSFAGGVVTLMLPMFFTVQNADQFTIIAGCRKRHDRDIRTNPSGVSDCVDKFDNIHNFQGEPHLPGLDVITKSP